ncbi:MAG: beta-ketoacyl-ACP synthase II [Chloroflexota bacterium]
MQRVVITGLGAVTPIGLNVQDFWRNLTQGVSGVGPITQFDATNFFVRIAAEVKGFDPLVCMDAKEARRTHRSAHFAVAATHQALDDANLKISREESENVGVVINTGGGGILELEKATPILAQKGPGRISPMVVPNTMANAPACLVSIHTGARGPVVTSTSACASGSQALLEAMHILQRGEVETIIAGATEAALTPVALASFANAGALSHRNAEPTRASRPFDSERDGFVMGEGAVVMILETEAHARKRGARIYAQVIGGALTGDAHHITAPDPEGDGARRAMRNACKFAGVKPEEIDVLYAHGTSTPLNDAMETKAIKAAFGEHAYRLAISATKSMIGHLVGAAGAASALAAVLSIRDHRVPPTINLEHPDPACDLDYVPNVARQMDVRVAMVNAFGFGGQNAVVVLSRFEE